MTRVRLDLSGGYMDVTLADDDDAETVDALRALGEAGLRWLAANDVARAWAYARADRSVVGASWAAGPPTEQTGEA